MEQNARVVGKIDAGINLPPYPAECRDDEPRIAIKPGDQKVALIDRADRALDRANARKNRCGPLFYDNVLREYGPKPGTGQQTDP